MHSFLYKLTNIILEFQRKIFQKRFEKQAKSFSNGLSSYTISSASELVLNAEKEARKAKIEQDVKEIVKTRLDDPEKLLNFINEEGTDVIKIKNADVLLGLIGEDEGFIPPLKGFKAFLLNIIVSYFAYNKIIFSFKSNEMFVLRPLKVDIYYMLHQFYQWYSYKMGMPGFDKKERENLKQLFKTLSTDEMSKLTLGEIIDLKETIERDKEAIDFVINLSLEYESSKKAVNKIRNEGSATI